ncbi:CDP-diacylglycerol--glycerol-3-phosphate 3-phosphatidyltransferase, partial [Coemansia aciculifera]
MCSASSRVQSAHQVFAPLTKNRPVFRITEAVEVIREPRVFYQSLLRGIALAKTRVVLSSLYLGSDEPELASALDQALASNQALGVDILLDCLRGTRADSRGQSSATMLAPLVHKYGSQRVRVSMYHTPALSGVSKRLWPQRYNETFGLQHIKAYVFDDTLIVSGANLSRDYFTNRQDRYIKISSGGLAAYFAGLVRAISGFSFVLGGAKPGGGSSLTMPADIPDPSRDPREFVAVANAAMAEFL